LAAAAKSSSPIPVSAKDEKKKPLPPVAVIQIPNNPNENKDSPESKKKKALETGPVLDLDQGNHAAYGMEESLFTALKDIFESIIAHSSKTGIVKPNKFLEILRRENDMFNGQQHQDAHEFLNYVLNQVIENVEAHQRKMMSTKNGSAIPPTPSGPFAPIDTASTVSTTSTMAGWIHELFEGLLSSETKCLTCENVSRRDEQFMDLSIDLEKNSSVTSCLRNFSASEMLCERNKFHCDACGGLQEAEKKMKIKRLPRVLALHLKRFKYMESTNRFEKLHYRVLYPYHLRLFNTTDDAEDPDRLYELYAVVVHIGGGPYHGHYVAIVKTEDKGWLLFDDELVEPVDKSYVRNFFGERTGTGGVASAYVLFYQETTLEAVQREMWADEQFATANETKQTDSSATNGVNGHGADMGPLDMTKADAMSATLPTVASPLPKSDHGTSPPTDFHPIPLIRSKKERMREKREERGREKAERKAAALKGAEDGKESESKISMSRFRNTSRNLYLKQLQHRLLK
jgi:ubiquitin carboxyl-terminal hydrolase 9/13